MNRERANEDAQQRTEDLHSFQLPPYVSRQLRKDDIVSDDVNLDNNIDPLENDENEANNFPTFFRRPFDRRQVNTGWRRCSFTGLPKCSFPMDVRRFNISSCVVVYNDDDNFREIE